MRTMISTTLRRAAAPGVLILLSLSLAGCPRPVRPPPPPASVPSAPEVDLRGATVYEIDPQASELSILVYRGGTLSRLGHNHVMTSKSLAGRVWLQQQFAKSGFELSFPVANLIVDDPQARRAAGSDFPPEIPQADKDGTRKNMLRPDVLDAEHYPRVEVRSVKVEGTLQAPQLTARITIKDASRDIAIPAAIAVDGSRLTASGEFDILQTDFGMKPFSVALGALEVQDRLHLRFKLVATKK
jgi:polyisoprenoid-binding protein YceI